MSDIALPGSIEPASAGGPKLDHSANPLTAILFLGVLTAGILFVAYSIYVDIDATGTKISNYLPFILLFVALMIASASCNCSGVSFAPTRLPSQASTLHQAPAPISVRALNFKKPIRTIPAGMEMRWRITGSKRAKKMPPAS